MCVTQQKPCKGAGMEGWLARWYASTRRNDLDEFRRQAKAVAERLPGGCDVLEVAPGPGYFAIELAKLGDFNITGLDISRTLVDIATENARNAGVKIDFRLGNASAMPFAGESFNFIYCEAALKNFAEPVKAFDEMHCVLRPGGDALIVDLRNDASLDEIDGYVKKSGRNPINAWITSWIFRHTLIKRAYTQDELRRMAEQSRFGSCQINVCPIWFEGQFTK